MRKTKHPEASLTEGWSQALLKPFVRHVRCGKHDNYNVIYKFKLDGFQQNFDEDGYEHMGLRYAKTERKAYGRTEIEMGNSKLNVSVFVTFCIKQEGEEFPSALGKRLDGRYVHPYYIGWFHFNEYDVDSSKRVPSRRVGVRKGISHDGKTPAGNVCTS